MRPLALAALTLAAPAFAQSTPEVPHPVATPLAVADSAAVGPDAVDPELVGMWALDEVAAEGRLGDLGVAVEGMTCDFDADGTARVEMDMVQDLDPIQQSRAFTFDTEDGKIVVPDDDDVTYRMLDDGRLELVTAGGLVVRLVRAGA